jgi:hypothetical protein
MTAAVLAAVLGAVSCGGSSRHQTSPGPAGSINSSATTTRPTTVQTTTTAPPDDEPYGWIRAASPALAVGGGASSTLAAVLAPAGSAGWIVAGTRLAADGSSTANVWTSRDGTSWRSTPLTGPQVDSEANAATTWNTATVVVGSVGRGNDSRAAVWIAAARGAPFVQVASGALSVGQSAMTSVAGGPLGLFAAGSADGHVAMWYSTNGQRWTSLQAADRVIAAATDPHIDALLVGTQGSVFAAGWERSGSSIVGALWSSGDGLNWHSVSSAHAAFAGIGDYVITGLAPFGTGFVAVGGSRIGSHWTPASWISPNGDSWSEPSAQFAMGARSQPDGSDAVVRDITAVQTGIHSATLTAVGGGPTAQRTWTSTDGLHWAELPLPPGAAAAVDWSASRVAVAGSISVVADSDPGQPHLLVRGARGWLEPSANPATFGTVQAVARPAGLVSSPAGLLLAVQVDHFPQVLGPSNSSIALFTSADATTWTPVASGDSFAGSRLEAVAALRAGFVAVGWTRAGAQEWATVWTSPNGVSWSAGARLDPRPVGASDLANGVCVDGALIAVVGSVSQRGGAASARAWVSSDGVRWAVVSLGPPTVIGTSTAMAGCAATPTGPGSFRVNVFGAVSGPGGNPGPAYWTAARITAWTRQTGTPFGASFPFPTRDVARQTTSWLAAGGENGAELPPGAPGTTIAGQPGLWRSVDGGANWQRLDTSGAPWLGATPAQIDRVAWLGSAPVVAGAIDGRLAVWTGISGS